MHYFSQKVIRKRTNYKAIGLWLIIPFILYTTHDLISFPSRFDELWFDIFIFSGFLILLGAILLTDSKQKFVIDNFAAVKLLWDFSDEVVFKNSRQKQQLELINNNTKQIITGTHIELQQQLLNLLNEQIGSEMISAFVNNFHWLGLNHNGIAQVKAKLREKHANYDLILANQHNNSNLPQIKIQNQELVISEKGLYKMIKPTHHDNMMLKREEYYSLQQTYKIKKDPTGRIIKFDEKIIAKSMFGISFKLPVKT